MIRVVVFPCQSLPGALEPHYPIHPCHGSHTEGGFKKRINLTTLNLLCQVNLLLSVSQWGKEHSTLHPVFVLIKQIFSQGWGEICTSERATHLVWQICCAMSSQPNENHEKLSNNLSAKFFPFNYAIRRREEFLLLVLLHPLNLKLLLLLLLLVLVLMMNMKAVTISRFRGGQQVPRQHLPCHL